MLVWSKYLDNTRHYKTNDRLYSTTELWIVVNWHSTCEDCDVICIKMNCLKTHVITNHAWAWLWPENTQYEYYFTNQEHT